MLILGIDPGLGITGYGCVHLAVGEHEPALVEAGVFRLDRRRSLPYRLAQLDADLSQLLADLAPDRMVVETLFTHARHVRTSILMGHARGVVLLAGERRGVELDELTATAVKKSLTGSGHASKLQVQRAVMAQCGLATLPEPPDLADAIAIALCAARRIAGDRMAAPDAMSGALRAT